MSKFNLLKALLLSLFFSLSVVGQTSSQLKQKYGKPVIETFLVGSQLAVSVTYTANGEVCEVKIEPYLSLVSNKPSNEEMPSKVVNNIIAELAPASQRGAHVGGYSAEFGRNGSHLECYEHVSIYKSTRGENYALVIIKWKRPLCQGVDELCKMLYDANAQHNNSLNRSGMSMDVIRKN